MGVYAAEVRGRTQGATDVGAKRERPITGGERCRRAARRSAWSSAEVERIVRCAVDVVVALPVPEPERNVGLAQNDCARGFHPGNGQGIFSCCKVLLLDEAPGRRQA